MEEGDKVIVLADMNKDLVAKDIKKFCKDTNLIDAIAALYGQAPIPTHQCRSKPINRIFVSKALLEDTKGGFLQFVEVTIRNHHTVWLDIKASAIGMHQDHNITRLAG